MSLDVRLKKADRIYRPGDVVTGVVVVTSKGSISHNGITMVLLQYYDFYYYYYYFKVLGVYIILSILPFMEGIVTLQLSAKSVGMFEAFYNSLKPIQLVNTTVEVAPPGKLPDGTTEIPFEIPLQPIPGQSLYETYHGVFVNVQYQLRCDMLRPLLAKNLQKTIEFIVETPQPKEDLKLTPVNFTITPDSLENVKKSKNIPRFKITGQLASATCQITQPFQGELVVEECDAVIKSIELQLVRVETCGCAEGFAKEATEIQNIQVAEGDVPRNYPIAMHMVFPRLFTCPTIATRTFKIEFEVNLVVMFHDGYLVSENFPIKLVRAPIPPPW